MIFLFLVNSFLLLFQYTWFLLPFILLYSIKEYLNNPKDSGLYLFIAGFCLNILIIGIIYGPTLI